MVTYPKDWNSLTLGDLGNIKMCRRIFSYQTEKNGQIPFYKIGTFGKKADAYISRDLYESYKSLYQYPKKGDILISAAGTIGRTVTFDGKDAYFQDSNIVWLDTSDEEVDSAFLKYFYESYPWTNLEGTTIRRLYNSLILGTSISLPSFPEQESIAETLSCLDDHIANLSELIEKKKAIRDGALENLVNGRTRVKGFTGKWENVTFNSVITPKARIGWQGLKKHEYLMSGYSYLIGGTDFYHGTVSLSNISYVSKERYDMDTNIQVAENDVLVTKDGTIGKVAIVPPLSKPATLNSGVFVFRTTTRLTPSFLYRVLSSSVFRKFIDALSAGSTIKHLYQKDLKKFEFNIPKDVDEQKAIVEVLSSLDAEIASLEEEKDKMLQIKAGAMDDLLTGRIRLTRQGG